MAKHRKKEFKEYIYNRLENKDELIELLDILALDIDNEASKRMVFLKLADIFSALLSNQLDEEISNMFSMAYKAREYDSCYDVVLYVFKHYFVAITASFSGANKELNRQLLIPFRNNISDVIFGVLASFRVSGNGISKLVSGEVTLAPLGTLLKENIDIMPAELCPSYLLYGLRKIKVIYNDFVINIRLRKPMIIKDERYEDNVIIQSGKGFSIMEDISKYEIITILSNPENTFFLEPQIEELKETIEEKFQYIRFYSINGLINQYNDEAFYSEADEDLEDVYDLDMDFDEIDGIA